MHDRTICGTTGEAFVNATRPYLNGDTWLCPDGKAACGNVDLSSIAPPAKPESVICMPADNLEEACPITDIKFFFGDKNDPTMTAEQATDYWTFVKFHEKELYVSDSIGPIDVWVAYSKQK